MVLGREVTDHVKRTGPVSAPAGAITRPEPSPAGEGRLRRRLPADRALPWALAAVFFALYTALSVRLHQRLLTTGYDLGIFEQAVRSYAHGRAPVSALKGPGFNLLGDHFSPVLASLAPSTGSSPRR